MQCFEIRKKLNAWVDNEVPPDEAEKIERHLEQCPFCRLEAEAIRQITAYMEMLPSIRAPDSLSRKTLHAFRDELIRPGLAEWWQTLTLSMRSAVCGVALAGLLCGAVLCTSIVTMGTDTPTDPYQTLYVSKGFLP